MKIAGYGRASTSKQELSPEVQEGIIREWFSIQTSVGRWKGQDVEFIGFFHDQAVSSKINMLDRPNGQHLLTLLDHGDMIVVAKFNRAFRSAGDSERTLDRLREAGIFIVFLDLSIDTSKPNGVYVASIMAAGARLERDMRSESTREALQLKKRRGEPLGRPPVGWKGSKSLPGRKKNYSPDIPARKAAEVIRQQILGGMNRDEIWSWVRRNHKALKLKRPLSTDTCVRMANAACLDFPNITAEELRSLGYESWSISFVRKSDAEHDQFKRLIRQYLKEKKRKQQEQYDERP